MDEQKPDEELQEEFSEIEESAVQPETETEQETVEATAEPEQVEENTEQPVMTAPVETQEVPQKLVEQPKQVGAPVPGRLDRLKSFITECKRVLRVTKKPDKQEFTTIVKISSVGMAIIGVIGFLVHFLKEILF